MSSSGGDSSSNSTGSQQQQKKEKSRKVFIPVDGSPDSERAFNWYVSNMKRETDIVRIFHMPEPVSLPLFTLNEGVNTPFKNWEMKLQERLKKVTDLEDHYNYKLTTHRMHHNSSVLISPSDASGKESLAIEICQEADKFETDMIVMASTGWGGVKKKLLKGGSVANFVVQMALLPVMLVPTAKNEARMHERRASIRRDSNCSN
ncbi:uncharacterized protein LOC142335297 [Convolutriloba macropyga]|uniref:uncharacterized protein LOC142335297 n=1 Tax=Convolutriloba macropyga TaxID=536237 RepID=UPI003F528E68